MVTSIAASSPKTASQPGDNQRVGGKDDGKPYVPFLIAGIGLAGVYFAHRLSKRREAAARFAAAATKFRDAFAPELVAAEAVTRHAIAYRDFLRAAYDERHAQAFIAFEPFCPRREEAQLQQRLEPLPLWRESRWFYARTRP